jgi:DNA-binding MarR family transcriptional regulator
MSTDSERFADAVVQFVRGFGLHRPERTPCGFDASVAEAHALGELAEGPLRQMELVERLGLTKSAVSHLVSGMVDRGWTEREGVSGDGRGVTLRLTRDGRTAASRLRRARSQRMEALLQAVPPDRRADAIEMLELLEEAARASDPRFV